MAVSLLLRLACLLPISYVVTVCSAFFFVVLQVAAVSAVAAAVVVAPT